MQRGSVVTEKLLSARSPPTLDKLCWNVILVIFEKLDTLEDVIRLALTSPTLWTIGKQRLCTLRDQYFGLWARCRIACIGDSVRDTPPGLLSNTDLANLETWVMEFRDKSWTKDVRRGLSAFLCASFSIKKDRRLQLEGDVLSAKRHFALGSVERLVADTLLDQPQPDSPVFRNLTKREYIREDKDMLTKIGDFGSDLEDYIDCDMLFEKVLLAQICWSADPTNSMDYKGVLHRGQWAGDRLDCVEMQYFGRERSAQLDGDKSELRPWKDITKEAWALLLDIYKAEADAY